MDKQTDFVLRTLEERDVRFVRLWFTDVLGFLKSVAIAPAELEGALSEGIGFDGSAIQGFARVYESDMLAHPDPSTFQVLPWRAGVKSFFAGAQWEFMKQPGPGKMGHIAMGTLSVSRAAASGDWWAISCSAAMV